jgi:hypothetical protein
MNLMKIASCLVSMTPLEPCPAKGIFGWQVVQLRPEDASDTGS